VWRNVLTGTTEWDYGFCGTVPGKPKRFKKKLIRPIRS